MSKPAKMVISQPITTPMSCSSSSLAQSATTSADKSKELDISNIDVDALRKNVYFLNERVAALTKATKDYYAASQVLNDKSKVLFEELAHFGGTEKDTRTDKVISVFKELEKKRNGVLQKLESLMVLPMEDFQEKQMKPVLIKDKESEDLRKKRDASLTKMKKQKHKNPLKQKAENEYNEAEKNYKLSNLDVVTGMKALDEKKWFNLNNWLTTYVLANISSVKQLQRFLEQCEDDIRQNTRKIFEEEVAVDQQTTQFEIDNKERLLRAPLRSDKEKQGYMQYKGRHMFWVVIDGYVSYYRIAEDNTPTQTIDLLTCTAKQSDKPLTFELISPDETFTLKVDTQQELDEWLKVIRAGIAHQLENNKKHRKGGQATSGDTESMVEKIQKVSPGNAVCADCGAKSPDWASINLGVIICHECSGVHRSMTTQYSKVRSLTMDRWEPQIFQLLKFIGNDNANKIFDAKLPQDSNIKPNPNSERSQRETYIFDKYKHKKYVQKPEGIDEEELSRKIYVVASTTENDEVMAPAILELLAFGGRINWQNPEQSNTTALHFFAAAGNLVGLELLLQNGADLRLADTKGWTPIHYAASYDRTGCARLLVNRGSPVSCKDSKGLTPLDLAIDNNSQGVKSLLEAQMSSSSDVTEKTAAVAV
eukprot:TRINITY_DN11211_c0_g1_i1.p1 TRINITY_DN11211_c0_g1~~TRINITY_DN11211_c0_g1_i1.p1  ORF type:complete len:650 (-),score=259.07 TRINITY_DN11211_c0_g1_i1:165-2114(-)